LAGAGQAQDVSEGTSFPDEQDIGAISTCLNDTDETIGVMAGRSLDLVAGPCRNLPGQTRDGAAACSVREAQVWAGLLDHELGEALQAARMWALL
jgi:hypothetical protein